MDISKLDELRSALETLLTSAPTISSDTLFSKNDLIEGLSHVRHVTRKQLEALFGSESEWAKRSTLKTLFKFAGSRDYSEGLFIAYYEPLGDGNNSVTRDLDKRFRDAVFMKGRRWSYPKAKRKFYHHLEIVGEELSTKKYPLDFWKDVPDGGHLTILTGWPPIQNDNDVSAGERRMWMPHVNKFEGIQVELPDCCNLWKRIARQTKFRKIKKRPRTAAKTKTPRTRFKILLKKAEQEWERAGACLAEPFRDHLRRLGWQTESISSKNLFDLITLYHCYDAPYRVDLFVSRDGTSPKSIVAITRPIDSEPLPNDAKAYWTRLCAIIGLLHDIEYKLAQLREASLRSYVQLERSYLKLLPRYARLIEIVKSIISAACEADGIRPQSIGGRPKDPESLFAKLCRLSRNVEADAEVQPFMWQTATLAGDLFFIMKAMSDLAGIRVVCTDLSEVEGVKKAIEKLFPRNLKRKLRRWRKHEEFKRVNGRWMFHGYRALHMVVSLGSRRSDLIECQGLGELAVEIQLQTACQRAWAAAAHPIIYKPLLAESILNDDDDVHQNMMRASRILEEADVAMTSARQTYEKLVGG